MSDNFVDILSHGAYVNLTKLLKKVYKLHMAGTTPSEIAKECNITEEQVLEILE